MGEDVLERKSVLLDARTDLVTATVIATPVSPSFRRNDLAAWRRELVLSALSIVCAVALVQPDIMDGSSIIIMLALGAAAITSSIAGFAFSAIAGAMLFHLSDDTVRLVQLMIACSIANQFTAVWQMRNDLNLRELTKFLPAGAMGVCIGAILLLHADTKTFSQMVGGFLVGYGVFMLMRSQTICRVQHVGLDMAVAFFSGVTGGLVGFPGALLVPWLGLKGWDKQRQRGLFQPFILGMQVLALCVISLSPGDGGEINGFEISNFLFIPFSLLATSLGMRIYGQLSNNQFARAMNVLLLVSEMAYLL